MSKDDNIIVIADDDFGKDTKIEVACNVGAFKFMEDLAKSAGDDLVYSLALERGNLFMCVTAYPSMTQKRFDTGEDGMRAVFLIDKDEYGDGQSDMVKGLTELINSHIYYDNIKPTIPLPNMSPVQTDVKSVNREAVTSANDQEAAPTPSPGHGM